MNLVFIYGPPAVGKYTISKIISKKLNYLNIHNHLTYNLVDELLDNRDRAQFFNLNNKIKAELIKFCLENNLNTIMTYAYAHSEDDYYIEQLFKLVKSSKVNLILIKLTASKKTLSYRVVSKDRLKNKKLVSKYKLDKYLYQYDFYQKIPGHNSIELDNTNLTLAETANKIIAIINSKTL